MIQGTGLAAGPKVQTIAGPSKDKFGTPLSGVRATSFLDGMKGVTKDFFKELFQSTNIKYPPRIPINYPPEFYQSLQAGSDFNAACKKGQGVDELSVTITPRDADELVLVIANIAAPTTAGAGTVTLSRGSTAITKLSYTAMEDTVLPWLDAPTSSAQCTYSISSTLNAPEKPQALATLTIPRSQGYQVKSKGALLAKQGKWFDVPGLVQNLVANEGEKVLVLCTIRYSMVYPCALSLGKFTILRDGVSLEPEVYGLQAVRASQSDVSRTLTMAFMDEPIPGPHIYSVRCTVVSGQNKPRVIKMMEDTHQLSLIRLPSAIIAGPVKNEAAFTTSKDDWVEVPGMSTQITTRETDKVLIVYHTQFTPTSVNYKAFFTVLRSGSRGSTEVLGDEKEGLTCVTSAAPASSEYPVVMYVDEPGAGTWTYSAGARSTRVAFKLDEASSVIAHLETHDAPAIEVGPYGSISAVLVQGSQPALGNEDGAARLALPPATNEETSAQAFLNIMSAAVSTADNLD